jgi:hypothetical protein
LLPILSVMKKSTSTSRLVRRALMSVLVACGAFAAVASVATAVPVGEAPGRWQEAEVMAHVVSNGEAQVPGGLAVAASTGQTPWFALGSVVAILVGMVLIGVTLRPEPVLVEMRSLRPIRPVDPRRRRTHPPA